MEQRSRAQETFRRALIMVLPVCLGLGVAMIVLLRAFSIFLQDPSLGIGLPLILALWLAMRFARWECRRQGVSLEGKYHESWQYHAIKDASGLAPVYLGRASRRTQLAGALGAVFFLCGLVWIGGRLWHSDLLFSSIAQSIIALGGLIFGLLTSVTALCSAGELARIDATGVVWVARGVRQRVAWTQLARAEVYTQRDVTGDLVRLEVQFYDREDRRLSTLRFGGTNPVTANQWSYPLQHFYHQLGKRSALDSVAVPKDV